MTRPIAITIAVASLSHFAHAQNYPSPPQRTVSSQAAQDRGGPPPNVGELMRQSGGSLYRASAQMANDPRMVKPADASYFAIPDPLPKTLVKHDLVTIVVNEESETSSEGTSDLKKDAGVDAKIAQFPSISWSNFALKNTIGSIAPEINITGSRNSKGQGTVDRKDSFTARIQAEVVDVKPNGTLILQARKRIVTDEEQQLFVLTGVCRVQDITPDNTVLSTQLYDLELQKKNSGSLRDTTKRGWVPRILDWVNPF